MEFIFLSEERLVAVLGEELKENYGECACALSFDEENEVDVVTVETVAEKGADAEKLTISSLLPVISKKYQNNICRYDIHEVEGKVGYAFFMS